jgi:hypothetical protein
MAVAPGPVWVQASGPATATFDVDYVYLMPADDTFTAITLANNMPTGSFTVADGVTDTVYQILDWTRVAVGGDPVYAHLTGSLPMLSPGLTRLYVLGPVYTGISLVDDTSGSMDLLVYYWPRYLSLAAP